MAYIPVFDVTILQVQRNMQGVQGMLDTESRLRF